MRQLSGLDSMFVSLESSTNLFHVGAIAVLDPATAPEGTPPPHEALRQVISDRLHLLPPFRRRLARVPGGLDHPWWVEDAGFDVGRHVHHGAVPAPGGPAELADYAASVLARPLDRDRPLWEIHVVEGLQGGLVAGIAKIHHAAIDGLAGVELTANLMDLSPEIAEVDPPEADWVPDIVRLPPVLAARGLLEMGRRAPLALGLVARAAAAGLRLRRHNREPDVVAPPGPLDAPVTPLTRRLSPRRSVASAVIDKSDVDDVRAATGATFNDVILTLVGSALRSHLEEQRELPSSSLVGFVPVAAREEGAAGHDDTVNQLSGMLVSLGTTVDDPVVRLTVVSESARAAKEQERLIGSSTVATLAEIALPSLVTTGARLVTAAGATVRRPPFNVVVSSFPGSPVPLYCCGCELVSYQPFGPIVDGSALNVTAVTYRDRLTFGLLADADVLDHDELASIAGRLGDSMGRLVKATSGRPRRRGRRVTPSK